MPAGNLILRTAGILIAAFGIALTSPPPQAEAKSCGGLNQKACPILKPGPRCDSGLRVSRGRCVRPKVRPGPKPCGGLNQRACNPLRPGPQCRPGLVKVRGVCVRQGRPVPKPGNCGRLNQPACPALKPGPRCIGGLANIRGRCLPCGGNNQNACPAIRPGPQCQRGLIKTNGICIQCGGLNQRACPALQKGRRCQGGLVKIRGICQRCGGANQQACPVTAQGPQCHRGLSKVNGRCLPCGGLNQRACPRLRSGPQCRGNLKQIKGFCRQCGGLNQRACPPHKRGKRCQVNLTIIKGICRPCGGQNQRACAVLNKGPQCQPGLQNVNGVCRVLNCGRLNQAPCRKSVRLRACDKGLGAFQGLCRPKLKNPPFCGRVNQPHCPITIRLKPCNKGLQSRGGVCSKLQVCGNPGLLACPKNSGLAPCVTGFAPQPITRICKPALVAGVQRTALETGKRCLQDLKPMVGPMARYFVCQKALGKFNALKRAIKAKNLDDAKGVVEAAACRSELRALVGTLKRRGFKSFSLGVSGNVKVGMAGGSGEYFLAMDLDLKNPTLYAQVGGSFGVQAGASLNGVVTAFYSRPGNLSGGGKSFSASGKIAAGAGAAIGLSNGKSPRCTSFSASTGIGAEGNAGTIGVTYTAKLFRIHKPDLTRGCKDVRIVARNQTGREVKVVDVDFYDYKQKRWRSKLTRNQSLSPGGILQRRYKLQKVGGDKTNLRVQYRVRVRNSGPKQWSRVKDSVSSTQTCRDGISLAVNLKNR